MDAIVLWILGPVLGVVNGIITDIVLTQVNATVSELWGMFLSLIGWN